MKPHSIAALINIVLCLFLLGDAFVFPRNVKQVTLTDFSAKHTNAKHTSYYNYFIYTSDHSKYEVTEGLYDNLKTNDPVTIFSSCIMHMPVAIDYQQDGGLYTAKIGQLNTKPSEKYGLYISLLLSAVVLLLQINDKSKAWRMFSMLFILALAVSFVVFVFVLIEVLSV